MQEAERHGTIALWLLLMLLWAAADGMGDVAAAAFGLAVTLAIALAVTRGTPLWGSLRFSPRRLLSLGQFGLIFLRELVTSNLAVLRLVYAPRMTLRPGIVPTRTALTSPLARFVLSNTVTLTPGSLVLGMEGETIHLHVLDLATTDAGSNTAQYIGPFDPILARALD